MANLIRLGAFAGVTALAFATVPLHAQVDCTANNKQRYQLTFTVTKDSSGADIILQPQDIVLHGWCPTVRMVWFAPPGYEFGDQGIVITNLDTQFSNGGTIHATYETATPGKRSRKFAWTDQNSQPNIYAYKVYLYNKQTGAVVILDPSIYNDGSGLEKLRR